MTENNSDSRAQEQCFICGYHNPHGLHEHHIVPQAHGGSDEPENTVFLCGSCHQSLHKLYDENALQRLINTNAHPRKVISEDTAGVMLDPQQSIDRNLPSESPHYTWERWCYAINVDVVEDRLASWREDRGPDVRNYFKGNRKYLIKTVEAEFENAKDHLSSHDYGYIVQPDDVVKKPHIKFLDESVESQIVEGDGRIEGNSIWTDSFKRIHCGYCHHVFSENQESDLARHVRLRHGVDDVYLNEFERNRRDNNGLFGGEGQ